MLAFWKRECQSYFHSPVGYVFIAGMLCIIGANTYMVCISQRMPAYESALSSSAFIFLFMVPILTMRIFSEDRTEGVLSFYYSMPLEFHKIVLGKYTALLTILLIPLLISVSFPIILTLFGALDMGIIAASYIGFFVLGAALLAVGLFFSVLLENQVAASAVTFVTLLISYFMPSLASSVPNDAFFSFVALSVTALILALLVFIFSRNSIFALVIAVLLCVPLCLVYRFAPGELEGVLTGLMNGLSVYSRFTAFGEGLLDVTTLVYYVTLVALMLFGAVQVLEYRRFR